MTPYDQFVDEATGIECLLVRRADTFTGYVRVPGEHPLHMRPHDKCPIGCELPCTHRPTAVMPLITYSNWEPVPGVKGWWFGFYNDGPNVRWAEMERECLALAQALKDYQLPPVSERLVEEDEDEGVPAGSPIAPGSDIYLSAVNLPALEGTFASCRRCGKPLATWAPGYLVSFQRIREYWCCECGYAARKTAAAPRAPKMPEYPSFSDLKGQVLADVQVDRENDEVRFWVEDEGEFLLSHRQDCCESVRIDDVCGDPETLIGETLEVAELRTNEAESEYGSATWSFYQLRSLHGDVTIRWYGSSNGYYSETVDFSRVE